MHHVGNLRQMKTGSIRRSIDRARSFLLFLLFYVPECAKKIAELAGTSVAGIWHTGLVAFGREHCFSGKARGALLGHHPDSATELIELIPTLRYGLH